MRHKVTTIQDVARISGVSTATVSRALSHPDRVAGPTRETVLQAVRETGYVANYVARNLRRRQTGFILALAPCLADRPWSDLLSGLASVLAPAGRGLLIAETGAGHDDDDWLEQSLDGGIADGIVLLDAACGQAPGRRRIPVLMACEGATEGRPTIRVDNAGGSAMAVRHLHAMGHRRIGHLAGPADHPLAKSRLAGLRREMARLGLALREDWVLRGDFGAASGAAAAAGWLRLDERPSAVTCASDEMACGFIGALARAGVRVPAEVSVVGFGDIGLAAHLTPALTTIRQPEHRLGQRAAEILLTMIDTRTVEGPSEILPVELVLRDSAAPPPG